MPAEPIRWGILSTGDVAGQFAHDLQFVEQAKLLAVASRDEARANAFAEQFDIPRRYGSYASLAADTDIDVVYIATPHPWHAEHSLLCLRAGKAVLCEKPLALNAKQAEAVINEARRRRLFLMEAMWTYFFPVLGTVRQCLEQDCVGTVHLVKADFCFHIEYDPRSRLFDPALGGGALLDVGVYPIALAQWVFQEAPVAIHSAARMCASGVDDQAALILEYAGGRLALLSCASRAELPQTAMIAGTKGRITIPRFSQPDAFEIDPPQPDTQDRFDRTGYGYAYEARHVCACLRQARTESDVMSLDRSLQVLRIMDTARSQWGLRYPMEDDFSLV